MKKKKPTAAQKRAMRTSDEQLFTEEDEELIEAWVRRYELMDKIGKKSEEAKGLWWAYEKLDGICRNTPEHTLKLINKILASTQNEFVLANLAAGPLEDLIGRHEEKVIDEVETLARQNPKFRSLLQGVWQCGSKEIWSRVLKASDRT